MVCPSAAGAPSANTLWLRLSHKAQAWQPAAACLSAGQSIAAKPSGKACKGRGWLSLRADAGDVGDVGGVGVIGRGPGFGSGIARSNAGAATAVTGAVCAALSVKTSVAKGCHTRTPISASMARWRESRFIDMGLSYH
jgi:hypothetical protein